jgi:hypothetical protein
MKQKSIITEEVRIFLNEEHVSTKKKTTVMVLVKDSVTHLISAVEIEIVDGELFVYADHDNAPHDGKLMFNIGPIGEILQYNGEE